MFTLLGQILAVEAFYHIMEANIPFHLGLPGTITRLASEKIVPHVLSHFFPGL
jgi:hypothetical protein